VSPENEGHKSKHEVTQEGKGKVVPVCLTKQNATKTYLLLN